MPKYSPAEIKIALDLYDQEQNVTRVTRILGYPTKATMYLWLRQRNPRTEEGIQIINQNGERNSMSFYQHRRSATPEEKLEAITRCFVEGEDVTLVSEQMGVSRQSIHNWRRIVEKNGTIGLMNKDKKKIIKPELLKPRESTTIKHSEIQNLQNEVKSLRMEIDVLKEALNLLKKDKGVDFIELKNCEKLVLVNALKENYFLDELLDYLNLPRSSYYYHQKRAKDKSKYEDLKGVIKEIFEQNRHVYGYRRIKIMLHNQGVRLSEKVIRRLMREMSLIPLYSNKKKKYRSYGGEISPAPDNIVNCDFKSDEPNKIWLTDITEFALSNEKVYLSPIVDCFDGKLISWSFGTSPNAQLVNDSLNQACLEIEEKEGIIIHTDRGVHYRWDRWIEITEEKKLVRSMSKKGCTGDNAACEGVFGRIKNECFYHKDFRGMKTTDFIDYLDDYLNWYNEDRIKLKFGCSINENRRKLGY